MSMGQCSVHVKPCSEPELLNDSPALGVASARSSVAWRRQACHRAPVICWLFVFYLLAGSFAQV